MLIYSLDNNYDNKDIIMVGFDLFNSYVILGKILNRHSERLKDECVSGRMLIHKLSGDVGMSYLWLIRVGITARFSSGLTSMIIFLMFVLKEAETRNMDWNITFGG